MSELLQMIYSLQIGVKHCCYPRKCRVLALVCRLAPASAGRQLDSHEMFAPRQLAGGTDSPDGPTIPAVIFRERPAIRQLRTAPAPAAVGMGRSDPGRLTPAPRRPAASSSREMHRYRHPAVTPFQKKSTREHAARRFITYIISVVSSAGANGRSVTERWS